MTTVVPMPKAALLDTIMESVAVGTSLVPVRSLDSIATDIKASHAETIGGMTASLEKAIRTGHYLEEAYVEFKRRKKTRQAVGTWADYVQLTCGVPLSTSKMYRKLARDKDKYSQALSEKGQTSGSEFSQARALKLLDGKRPKRSTSGSSPRKASDKENTQQPAKRGGWWPFGR